MPILIKGSGGGIDTSDATAVESNVVSGKTFYANGEKKTGSMEMWDGESQSTQFIYSDGSVYLLSNGMSGGYIQAGDSCIQELSDPTSLGDATASDVAVGKTFTSANGVKVAGTKEEITLQAKTVSPSTSSQIVTPDSGYGGLSKVTVNAMTAVSKATPSISVSSSGLITASATQSAGYVTSGTVSNTKQLSTKSSVIVTPGTSQLTAVSSGVYTTGNIYVSGDSNLVSSNIKSGVSIFGVSGSYTGGGSVGYVTGSAVMNNGTVYNRIDFDNIPVDTDNVNDFVIVYNGDGRFSADSDYDYVTSMVFRGGSLVECNVSCVQSSSYIYITQLSSSRLNELTVYKGGSTLQVVCSTTKLTKFIDDSTYSLFYVA